jgi:hypothetical protein
MVMFTVWRNMIVTFDDVTGAWNVVRDRAAERAATLVTSPAGQTVNDTDAVSLKFANTGETVLGNFDDWDLIFEMKGVSGIEIKYLSYTVNPAPAAGEWTISGIYLDADTLTDEITDLGILNPSEEMIVFANPGTSAYANAYNRATFVSPNGVPTKVIFQSLPIVYVLDESDRIVYRYDSEGNYLGFNSINAANTDAKGLTNTGGFFWTTDIIDDEVYKYDSTFFIDSSWGQSGLNNDAEGITTDGANIWTVQSGALAGTIYKYDMAGTPDVGLPTFDLFTGNADPSGLTTDGTHLWVVDEVDDLVYQYTVAGASVSSFALNAANADPSGITTDGAYFWVTDVVDAKVYYYRLDGTYQSSFDLFAANADPQGVTVTTR